MDTHTFMYKMDYLVDGEWVEHSFSPQFACVTTANGTTRVVAGVPNGDTEIFERLVSSLEPPCYLLYVLHTPRGEGEAGRYQSPELSLAQLRMFIA